MKEMNTLSLALVLGLVTSLSACGPEKPHVNPPSKPALVVEVVRPQPVQLPMTVLGQGMVQAWQEASIGAEVNNLRVVELYAEVGDVVKKGQPLAKLNSALLQQEYEGQKAALAEAEATYVQAQQNAKRARLLEGTDSASAQELLQFATQEKSARAKRDLLRAQVAGQRLKLSYATVVAPDNGVISARQVAQGQVVSANTELFKLIRQNRLEWKIELPGEALSTVVPGQIAKLRHADGQEETATVDRVAPALDATTRTGIAYARLPADTQAKAGMYLQGYLMQSAQERLVVPAKALVFRDGYAYVAKLDERNKVSFVKVETHPVPQGDSQVALLAGVGETDRLVAAGAAFLANGDVVQVAGGLSEVPR